jgi:hypothetical protein
MDVGSVDLTITLNTATTLDDESNIYVFFPHDYSPELGEGLTCSLL